MKKSFSKKLGVMAICVLTAGMLLTGCGDSDDGGSTNTNNNNNSTNTNTQTTPSGSQDVTQGADATPADSYTFTYNGTTIAMNADMTTITSALGEPTSYFEAESCAFQGLDKTYTYGSVVITTYPDNDKDFVYSIELKDDTVETKEGIYIGASKDAVTKAYGTPSSETDTAYVYTKGKCDLTFIFADDAVTSITYVAITD